MARACRDGVVGGPFASGRNHRDAIDGAWRQAKLATGAAIAYHGVHPFRRSDDRIDWTRADAQRAADACRLIDASTRKWATGAKCGIERKRRNTEQLAESGDRGIAAGRTAIDWGGAIRDGLGIRSASLVAALLALCLRQQGFNSIHKIAIGG